MPEDGDLRTLMLTRREGYPWTYSLTMPESYLRPGADQSERLLRDLVPALQQSYLDTSTLTLPILPPMTGLSFETLTVALRMPASSV